MKALICGVSGQDGAYLSRLLLSMGYEVIGSSRDAVAASFSNLSRLGIYDGVEKLSIEPRDFRSIFEIIRRDRPDEIYNLAGQSSVGLSFDLPVETIESIAHATLNILESIRLADYPARFYNAGSGECFGETGDKPATELTPFSPNSPYAAAKVAAHHLTRIYRESYGIFACTGVLFNHESSLRPKRFVTQKIVSAARAIAQGKGGKLVLGNLDIERDWGWAPEYVDAMWRMLQQPRPEDIVIATGKSVPLRRFIQLAFGHFGLDWEKHVVSDASLYRPLDILRSSACPEKAKAVLGWSAKVQLEELVSRMCEGSE